MSDDDRGMIVDPEDLGIINRDRIMNQGGRRLANDRQRRFHTHDGRFADDTVMMVSFP